MTRAQIEAMACGTPVIAFRRGSVGEVVEHRKSGFVVAGEAEAVSALTRIQELDRRQVRDAFERRFTSRQMANNYLTRRSRNQTGRVYHDMMPEWA